MSKDLPCDPFMSSSIDYGSNGKFGISENAISFPSNKFNEKDTVSSSGPNSLSRLSDIRKRKSITVQEKLTFLRMVEGGEKISVAAGRFGIAKSTACTIWKDKHKIKLLIDQYKYDPQRKRLRLGAFPDVNEAMGIWFRQAKTRNEPVTGPILQQKALEFADLLGHKDFKASSGWLNRLRERYDMSVGKMKGVDKSDVVSGVGMTDDEILMIVRQNNVAVDLLPSLYPDCVVSEGSKNYEIPIDTNEELNLPQNDLAATDNVKVEDNGTPDDSSSCHFPEIGDSENRIYPYCPSLPNGRLSLFTSCSQDSGSDISVQDASVIAKKLVEFLSQRNDIPKEVLESVRTVNSFISNDLLQKVYQRKITDYFKCLNH